MRPAKQRVAEPRRRDLWQSVGYVLFAAGLILGLLAFLFNSKQSLVLAFISIGSGIIFTTVGKFVHEDLLRR